MKELGRGRRLWTESRYLSSPGSSQLKVWVRSLEVLEVGWGLKGELLRQSGVLGQSIEEGGPWGGDQSVVGSLGV